MAVVLEWVETGQVFPLPLGRPVVIGRGRYAEIGLDAAADLHRASQRQREDQARLDPLQYHPHEGALAWPVPLPVIACPGSSLPPSSP